MNASVMTAEDEPLIARRPESKLVPVTFRWDVEQTSRNQINLIIPVSITGHPVLNPAFVEGAKLTDREIDRAEDVVFRAIAIVS